MGDYLTSASTLMCPHGGSVSPVPGRGTVTVAGAAVLTSGDSFPIGGCPFPPSGPPHPCIQVQWVVDALRGATDAATLTTDSVGLCKAADGAVQGQVLIQATQSTVTGL
jgi:hypothetical protein